MAEFLEEEVAARVFLIIKGSEVEGTGLSLPVRIGGSVGRDRAKVKVNFAFR